MEVFMEVRYSFHNVALALRKANFVGRKIDLKQISPLSYCQPFSQFCLNDYFYNRLGQATSP